MPFAQFDDRYDDHRKTKRAWRQQPAAVALHAMAITYSNRHKTDGLIDAEWVEEKLSLSPLNSRQRAAVLDTLLDTGLFEREGDDYRLHHFLEWNRSRAQREALAKQGRLGGLAKARGMAKPKPEDGSSHELAKAKPALENGSSTPRQEERAKALSPEERASEDDKRLCGLLRELAEEHNPKFKVKSPGRWLTDMRLLRERDGNSPQDIERAIRWVFTDAFWPTVIQSPGNLREHFAQIWGRMNAAPRTGRNGAPVESSDAVVARMGASR